MFLDTVLKAHHGECAKAIRAVARGEVALLLDRTETMGYLMASAVEATAASVARLRLAGNGFICAAMPNERMDALQIPAMPTSQAPEQEADGLFVSVDWAGGRGVAGSDQARALTLRKLADPAITSDDLKFPGHVFPITEDFAGGIVEVAIDLMRLIGHEPVAALARLAPTHDEAMSAEEVVAQAKLLGLPVLRTSEVHALLAPLPAQLAEALLPTRDGTWRAVAFRGQDGHDHLALVLGAVHELDRAPVYVHRSCLFGEALASLACECRTHLDLALQAISTAERGVLVYLTGGDPFGGLLAEAHGSRPGDGGLAAEVLAYLGLTHIELAQTASDVAAELRSHGLEII